MAVPPPGGSYQGSGDSASEDIGPPETEYGPQFVATRPILGLCEGKERRGGTWVPQRWWEHPRIDWRLAREQGEIATEEAAGHTHTDATAGTKTTTTEAPGSGKGTGEEASLGASGSSGEEWSGAED